MELQKELLPAGEPTNVHGLCRIDAHPFQRGSRGNGRDDVCSDPTKLASKSEVVKTVPQVATLARTAEREMHEAVLTRARRGMLRGITARKPTLH
jgi:hypothetical protein